MITRGLRMLAFQMTLFARNTYFSQLLLTSTLSVLLLQYVASFGSGAAVTEHAWLRAGMVGTWTMCAVSTGLIGFQRFQGTLVHQVSAPIGARSALLPVVGSAATFGLLAFPLAAGVAALLGLPLGPPRWSLLIAMAAFWLASLSVSLVIAALFAHHPDALVYESLVAAPVILLSGVFGLPQQLAVLDAPLRVLPLSSAVHAMSADAVSGAFWIDVALTVAVSAIWFAAAALLASAAVRRAVEHATVDLT